MCADNWSQKRIKYACVGRWCVPCDHAFVANMHIPHEHAHFLANCALKPHTHTHTLPACLTCAECVGVAGNVATFAMITWISGTHTHSYYTRTLKTKPMWHTAKLELSQTDYLVNSLFTYNYLFVIGLSLGISRFLFCWTHSVCGVPVPSDSISILDILFIEILALALFFSTLFEQDTDEKNRRKA